MELYYYIGMLSSAASPCPLVLLKPIIPDPADLGTPVGARTFTTRSIQHQNALALKPLLRARHSHSFFSSLSQSFFAMKFFTTFAVLVAAVATVGAVEVEETNAARMARGLPPKAPHKRGSPTFSEYYYSISWRPQN